MAGPPLVLLLAAPLNSVNSVAGPCPPLALLLAAPLNSSSSCPPLGRAPELCQLCGWAPWLRSAERKTEKEKLKEKEKLTEKEREREREKEKEQGERARAL